MEKLRRKWSQWTEWERLRATDATVIADAAKVVSDKFTA